MRHMHQCRLCKRPFECVQVTHCRKVSDDDDYMARPVCYNENCEQTAMREFKTRVPATVEERAILRADL